jgi:hypothetical protein
MKILLIRLYTYIYVYGYKNLCNKWLCIMNEDVSSLGSDALINKID